jgi:uncharacterized protein (UPF0305 family)
MDLQALNDIAEIRQLKARYCRLLDSEEWDAWAECFTPDLTVDISDELKQGQGETLVNGREKMIEQTRRIMSGSISQHLVYEPEIELTSATTAKAIWAMSDRTEFPEGVKSPGPFTVVEGTGYYYETYEKAGGRWRIKSQKLVRKRKAYR